MCRAQFNLNWVLVVLPLYYLPGVVFEASSLLSNAFCDDRDVGAPTFRWLGFRFCAVLPLAFPRGSGGFPS